MIPAHQILKNKTILMEPDMSSAFAMAAAGALAGHTEITNFVDPSLQPDHVFVEILKTMNIPVNIHGTSLVVEKADEIKHIELNLAGAPDLFPILSILCAFAKGDSKLLGAPQLVHKESNRIKKTAELLSLAGVSLQEKPDGIMIFGQGPQLKPRAFTFDPDQDHRMAMAAGLLKLKGFDIEIKQPDVVNKSFREFWICLGIKP